MLGLRKKKESIGFETEDSSYREITQDVAMCMYQMGITSEPILRFFSNDNGILEGLYLLHVTDNRLFEFENMSDDTYAKICGMHAMGAGIYTTIMQVEFQKPVWSWGESEMHRVVNDFIKTDAYELALKKLGYAPRGNNKRVLDRVILSGLQSAKNNAEDGELSNIDIRSYMQVMFNAGVTLVMRNA